MKRSVLCGYYARGVALVLVGLALARPVGILHNPAWLSDHPASWASSFYPYSVAFLYLTVAFLFGYAGFFLREKERDLCLLVEGAGLLMVVAAGGLLLGLWLAMGQIILTTHNVPSLVIGSTSILLAEWTRRSLPKEEEEGSRGEPRRG